MPYDVFVDATGGPILAPCAILYIDLLGVSAMTGAAEAQANLERLDEALRRTYRDFLELDSPWPAAMFSDTLVLAAPIDPVGGEEPAIGGLILQAAWIQLNLALRGIFLRGGLALGFFHIRDGLQFGPALVEAYRLEDRIAVQPRIVLSSGTAESQRADAMNHYAEPGASSQNAMLLVDQDGVAFINYLALLLDEPDDPRPGFAAHRDIVAGRLGVHQGDSRRWEKYRWTAEFHNQICRNALPSEPEFEIDVASTDRRFDRFIAPR